MISFSRHRLDLFHHGCHRTDCALREIDAGHGLIDLQGPWLARLGIDVVPVEETKRDVAVFLHFKDHDVAQRMDGPSPNQDRVARLGEQSSPSWSATVPVVIACAEHRPWRPV